VKLLATAANMIAEDKGLLLKSIHPSIHPPAAADDFWCKVVWHETCARHENVLSYCGSSSKERGKQTLDPFLILKPTSKKISDHNKSTSARVPFEKEHPRVAVFDGRKFFNKIVWRKFFHKIVWR